MIGTRIAKGFTMSSNDVDHRAIRRQQILNRLRQAQREVEQLQQALQQLRSGSDEPAHAPVRTEIQLPIAAG